MNTAHLFKITSLLLLPLSSYALCLARGTTQAAMPKRSKPQYVAPQHNKNHSLESLTTADPEHPHESEHTHEEPEKEIEEFKRRRRVARETNKRSKALQLSQQNLGTTVTNVVKKTARKKLLMYQYPRATIASTPSDHTNF